MRFIYKSGAYLFANYIYGQILKKLHNWVSMQQFFFCLIQSRVCAKTTFCQKSC